MRFEEYLLTKKKELFPDDLSKVTENFIDQDYGEDDFIKFIEELDISTDEQASLDGYGELFVDRKGKFLIIHPPKFRGKKADSNRVLEMLQEKGISSLSEEKIQKLIIRPKKGPFFIEPWVANPTNDGRVIIKESSNQMEVTMKIIPPKADGRFIDKADVFTKLKKNQIVYGIMKDAIIETIEKKNYKKKVIIAKGKDVIDGENAKIEFKINLDKKSHLFLNEDSDRVNYKELNFLPNVKKNQIIAEKIPRTEGKNGKTVKGKKVIAVAGEDIDLVGGENTFVTPDGMYLKSMVNGHMVKEEDIFSVREVYTVNGDVGPKTGNITSLNSVKILGSVLDGYNVKAEGSIEIEKSVGACQIEANGDILIGLGVSGKDRGKLISNKGDIYSKHIQNVTVKVNNLYIRESIIHCDVFAMDSIFCQGKKASIIGGVTRAYNNVFSKTLGSSAGTKTVVEVGVLPELRGKIKEIESAIEKTNSKILELKLNITSLERAGQLDDESTKELDSFKRELDSLEDEINSKKQELEELNNELENSLVKGKITVVRRALSGVLLRCNTAELDIKRDQFPSYFLQKEGTEQIEVHKIKNLKEIKL